MGGASAMAKNVLKANYEQQLQQHPLQRSDSKACPYNETTVPVDINNMLLRGHVIRNTYWVIAVIVATGTETKIMLNSGETPSKRSRIEKTMNIQVRSRLNYYFDVHYSPCGSTNGSKSRITLRRLPSTS